MQLKLVTNQSNGNFSDYVSKIRNTKMTQGWRLQAEATVDLIKFIEANVEAPAQWFVISHMSWVHFVRSDTYYAHKDEITLTTWVVKGVYYFKYTNTSGEEEKVRIDNKGLIKEFLESFFQTL